MPIQAQAADGTTHEFPDGTQPAIIDKAMKSYAQSGAGSVAAGKPGRVPSATMGMGEGFMTGLQDPLIGGKQLYSHALQSPEQAATVDKQVQQREADIASKGGGGISRVLGEVTTGAPLMAAGPLGIAGAAAGGAAQGALQPVTGKGNYWDQKTNDMLLGGAFGGGLGVAGKVIGAGSVAPDAKKLLDAGVNLTPGQLSGGVFRRAEEAFKSFPILGSFIRGAEGRGIEQFNTSVLNQALEPIGAQLPKGIAAGNEAIGATQKIIGNAYDKLLPTLNLTIDKGLTNDISNIRFRATELPKPQQEQLDGILSNRLASFFQRSPMPGRQGPTLKETESSLRAIADNYRSSADPAQRNMAYLIDDARGALRDALERQNPGQAKELQKIDTAYAMFARAQGAASRRATSEGVFTPNDLLQTIKQQDKSVRKGSFARGDALMQDFAQYGQAVLPAKMPDSGTTERALYDTLLLAAAGGAETGHISPWVAAGLGGGAAPYTRPGIGALNAVARSPIGGTAPYAAIGATPAALRGAKDEPQYQGPVE